MTNEVVEQSVEPDEARVVCLRLPQSLVRELDAFRHRHAERAPGSVVSRNGAVRFLLRAGLRAEKGQP